MKIKLIFIYLVCAMLALSLPAVAQTDLDTIGSPQIVGSLPVEYGSINLANGNLHLEIPLSNSRQRGDFSLPTSLVYDSKIWEAYNTCTSAECGSWNLTNNAFPWGGWNVVSDVSSGKVASSGVSAGTCQITGTYDPDQGTQRLYYGGFSEFSYTDEHGSEHLFPIETVEINQPGEINCTPNDGGIDISSGSAYATDGSGYFMSVSAYNSMDVWDAQGRQVAFANRSDTLAAVDRNGNYVTSTIDTRGRHLPVDPGGYGVATPTQSMTLPVAGGKTATFTFTFRAIPVHTAFNTPAFPDYNADIGVLDRLTLPDGSFYQFSYDEGGFGELTGITLPHGGQVQFSYTSIPNTNICSDGISSPACPGRFATHHSGSDGITNLSYSFQDSSNTYEAGNVCGQISTSVNNAEISNVYGYVRCNGSIMPTEVAHYVSGNIAAYEFYQYDSSHQCPNAPNTSTPMCLVEWKNITSKQTILVNSDGSAIESATEYTYDHPEVGIPTGTKEWDYYPTTVPSGFIAFASLNPPGNPTRETDITLGYPVMASGLFPLSLSRKDSSGSVLSSETYTYDEPTYVQSITGLPQHDSSLLLTPSSRGNLTTLTRCCAVLNGSSTSVQTHYWYDDAGTLQGFSDEEGNKTALGYDDTDTLPTSITHPKTGTISHVKLTSYDPLSDDVLGTVNQNGQITKIDYDAVGRPAGESFSNGLDPITTSLLSYPSANEIDEVVPQSAGVDISSSEIVDGYGRTVQQIRGGKSKEITYNARGQVSSTTNTHTSSPQSTDGTSSFIYDAFGRTITLTSPRGNTETYTYKGNAATVTDPLGHKRQFTYDRFGDLTSVLEPDGSGSLSLETDYLYDGLGRLVKITQKGGTSDQSQWRVRSFSYDGLSRLLSEGSPEAGTTSYDYYPSGRTKAVHSANPTNNTVTYQYDALGRKTAVTLADGSSYSYAYDAADGSGDQFGVGKLTSVSNSDGSVQQRYQHDAMGNLIKTSYCLPSDCTFNISAMATYDYLSNLRSLIYPDGREIDWTYDKSNLPTEESYSKWQGTAVNSPILKNISYSMLGGIQQATMGNSVKYGATYDPDNNLSSTVYESAGVPLIARTYTWAQNDQNLLGIQDLAAGRSISYQYDQLDRLSSINDTGTTNTACVQNLASVPPSAQSYTIDAWGNLQQAGTWSFEMLPASNNRISGLGYDAAGNVLQETITSGITNSYTYNSLGLLVSSNGSTYTYDGMGERVRKDGSSFQEYIYFSGHLIAVKDGTGQWTDRIKSPLGDIATIQGVQNATPIFRATDHLGTLANLFSSSGQLSTSTAVLPFGQTVADTSGDDFIFTGHQRDEENGTDHTLYRQYSSREGRWLSPDPSSASYHLEDPQSLNRYSYVRNFATSKVDKDGLDDDEVDAIISWDYGDDEDGGGVLQDVEDLPLVGQLAGFFADLFGFGSAHISVENKQQLAQTLQASYDSAHGAQGIGTSYLTWSAPVRHPSSAYVSTDSTNGVRYLQAGIASPQAPNVNKHYGLTTPCSSSASQVMGAVQSNFSQFGNYSAGPFSVSFSPAAGMGVGSTVPIAVGTFGFTQNMGVRVASMSSQSMSFNTLPGGHLFYPGSITFAASPASAGSINFNINLSGTFNGATNAAKYYAGGALFENAQWNHFLGQVGSFCGVGH